MTFSFALETLRTMPTALPYAVIACALESSEVGAAGHLGGGRPSRATFNAWRPSCGLQARTTKKDLPFGLDRSPIQEETP